MNKNERDVELVLRFRSSVDSYEEAERFYRDVIEEQSHDFSVGEKRIEDRNMMVPYNGGDYL